MMILEAPVLATAADVAVERRGKLRYPVTFEVRYRSLDSRHPAAGIGRSINISSAGLLVAAKHEIRQNVRVEVRMDWPFLLNGVTRLQLVAIGKVVRWEDSSFALEFQRHQFRTMKRALAAA